MKKLSYASGKKFKLIKNDGESFMQKLGFGKSKNGSIRKSINKDWYDWFFHKVLGTNLLKLPKD